jgi:hypothetical protein
MWLRTASDRSKRTEPYVMILAEASTAADGLLSREHSDFGRCGSAILGFGTPRSQSRGAAGRFPGGTPILFALAALRSVPQAGSQFRGLATVIHGISGL